MTEHHLLSPYNWICGIFSKFVMVNMNDKKEWAGERSSTLSRVYLPFFQLICLKQLLKVSVLSGSLTSLWPASFGLYACLDFGPCPKFLFLSLAWVLSFYFFSPFLGCFLFIKVDRVSSFDRVSSQSAFLDYTYIYFKSLNSWDIFYL
jgi:hypothetical protein